MPPPPFSPAASSTVSSRAKTPNTGRPSTTSSSTTAGRLRTAKVRGSSDKENRDDVPSKMTGRGSAASERADAGRAVREKPPSKDGTAQRHAKEVEGLKDYQLGQRLGQGAFGSVYCALNWSTGETVAIKQVRLSSFPSSSSTSLNTIMQEIDLLKNLHHPNIVKYHGSTMSSDSLYIILEYCEQGSLHQICKNYGKFPENLVGLYTAQVLQGLHFLHEQGVIHRDIKGANILTTKEGLVKLADFGVATSANLASNAPGAAADASVVGTPYWMAPEIIELSGATTASDIWSLGCTVIELLTSHPPYHNFAPMPALFRIVNDDHPPLPDGCSPQVRDFLMQCFQKDPNLRVSAKKLLRHPWILSARKADTRKPEYEEAVRSVQQWNEALKASPPQLASGSRRSSTRPESRPMSRSSIKSGVAGPKTRPTGPVAATKIPFRVGSRKSQNMAASPSTSHDEQGDDWEADFESLTAGLGALRLPDRLKPLDNFAGEFSSAKLKQYANIDTIPEVDGKVEGWDEDFEGDMTIRSPLELTPGNALQTVRPFYPVRTTTDEIKHAPPGALPMKNSSELERAPQRHERKKSKDSQPRTQILRPTHQPATKMSKTRPAPGHTTRQLPHPAASHKDRFREGDEEDYSDLIPNDESIFLQRLSSFSSPSRPLKPTDLRSMQSKVGGSMRRRRTQTPTQLVHDAAAIRRSRSSLEIQKYAEADEDDYTDLVFDSPSMQLTGVKTRSPRSVSASSDEEDDDNDAGDDDGDVGDNGTLKLSSSALWGDDENEDDDEDPFAALEEELDVVDLELNVARDKHARLCGVVESLVGDLKLNQPDDVLESIISELLSILSDSPDIKSVVISAHGMLPILEILDECTKMPVVLRLLKVVNFITLDDMEVQENLCFVGGIPIITKFAHKKYPLDIRLEAASFVRTMYEAPLGPSGGSSFGAMSGLGSSPGLTVRAAGGLTLQMFVSCGGLNVLVEFLEEDYDSEAGRELVLVGVNGIWSVFELQGATPKNDFCRIFSRSSVLYPLSLVLNRVLEEHGEDAEVIESRIVNIFLLFSQAENHVKETVADRMVLKRVLKDLKKMSPACQVTMLKFIKNLSMLATTLDALQNSNAIEVLTDLLATTLAQSTATKISHANAYARDLTNQILTTMYNLCRLSKARQEDAALSGIIPLLQSIVKTDRPLKEFALPILCDMAHSGKVGRKILWQNKGLAFYVRLLGDQYWAVEALEAIGVWAQEETAKVEEHLLSAPMAEARKYQNPSTAGFADMMIQCFNESKADAFENLLEPLQKLLRLSPPVAASLAHKSLFERSAVKLHSKKALVRLNLLRVIRSICDACAATSGAHEGDGGLLHKYGLYGNVQGLAQRDPAILVREMANELVKSSEVRAFPAARPGYGLRRSSSSLSTSLTGGVTPGTPTGLASDRRQSYFDLPPPPSSTSGGVNARAGLSLRASPLRSEARDSTGSSNSSVGSTTASGALRGTGLQSRQSMAALSRASSRLSLAGNVMAQSSIGTRAPGARGDGTPTHAPPSANTRAALAEQRRRRQTSGAELGDR